jgi:hypothetical protein
MPQPLPVRTSERGTWKRCRQQWAYAYMQLLKPKTEAPALRFGGLIHKALELRYPPGVKRGPHPAKTFAKLFDAELEEAETKWGFRDSDGEWADAKELGVAMLEAYVDEFGKDERYKVISSEQTFRVPVLNPNTGKIAFYYVGTIDGVWEDRQDKSKLLNDYKTTKNNPEDLDYLALDDQADAYWTWGVDYLYEQGILKPKDKLKGMIYTYLRKGMPDLRPRNADGLCLNKPKKEVLVKAITDRGLKMPGVREGSGKNGSVVVDDLIKVVGEDEAALLGEVSDRQPAPLFHREKVFRSEVEREFARPMAYAEAREMFQARQGKLEIYMNPGGAPPLNNCRFCGYRELCEIAKIGGDVGAMIKATMKTWDPYDAHEIAEEGKGN